MRISRLYILLFLNICFSYEKSCSQDFHFSNLTQSRTYYNPANCGNFVEDFKLVLGNRNQYATVPVGYNTFLASIESKYKSKSFGLTLLNDKAGDASWQITQIIIPFSLRFNNYLNTGINMGIGAMPAISILSFDPNKLYYNNQFNGDSFDSGNSSRENFNSNRSSYMSTNFGISLGYAITKKIKLESGYAYKLNSYFFKKINTSKNSIGNLQNYYLNALHTLSETNFFNYELNYSSQRKYKQLILSAIYTHIFSKNSKLTSFKMGSGVRINDAFIIYTGLTLNKTEINFSYDINYSSFNRATNSLGAAEIMVSYKFFKTKEYKSNLHACPVYF
jgi:type IX secretion system PorP/SprF family membrane protein